MRWWNLPPAIPFEYSFIPLQAQQKNRISMGTGSARKGLVKVAFDRIEPVGSLARQHARQCKARQCKGCVFLALVESGRAVMSQAETSRHAALRCDIGVNALSQAMQDALLAAVPRLRSYAISLCGRTDQVDDLVQETLLRAIVNINSFRPGTNLCGWLTTILRNQFVSEFRKNRNVVEDTDGRYTDALKSVPEQESRIDFGEFRAALAMLPFDQQEALLLVCALGLPCEEVAVICGTPVATIRSRIHRARLQLTRLFAVGGIVDFGPDDRTRAVLAR